MATLLFYLTKDRRVIIPGLIADAIIAYIVADILQL
jgi:hypothetical protein